MRRFPQIENYIAKYGEDDGWFIYLLAVDLFYFGSDWWFEEYGA
jgi:hypothetical protein